MPENTNISEKYNLYTDEGDKKIVVIITVFLPEAGGLSSRLDKQTMIKLFAKRKELRGRNN